MPANKNLWIIYTSVLNGCPCGDYGDPKRECHCTPQQIQRYRNRVSGPLLDRIDIQIDVPAVRYEDLTSLDKGESSTVIRERVIRARKVQEARFADNDRIYCNANMGTKELNEVCRLDFSRDIKCCVWPWTNCI